MTDSAQLRVQAYRLFSRLFLLGIDSADLPTLRAVPDLAPLVPQDLDEAAAEHHRVLSTEVPPYASVFLEPDGTLGGATSRWVERERLVAGLPATTSETADHLGRELELLGALGNGEAAGRVIDHHLLRWLPAFVVTVDAVESEFWSAVSHLVLDVVLDHRAASGGETAGEAAEVEPRTAPAVGPLQTEGVPADRVARFVSPVLCGAYLTPHELRGIGRTHRLPSGFGGRARLLETLLDSADAYETELAVTEAILTILKARRAGLVRLREEAGLPEASVRAWVELLDEALSDRHTE